MASSRIRLTINKPAKEVFQKLTEIFDGGQHLFVGYLSPWLPEGSPIREGSLIEAIGEKPPFAQNVDVRGKILEYKEANRIMSFGFEHLAYYDENRTPFFYKNKKTIFSFVAEDHGGIDTTLHMYVEFKSGWLCKVKTDDVMSEMVRYVKSDLELFK